MNYYFFIIPVVLEMQILSALHSNASTSPSDTIEAAFIRHINDRTVVFNNQIMTGLLLLRTHGCKYCQTRGFAV